MIVFDTDKSLRWLFCMTHPDDEISICAWIRTLTRLGADVFISWTHHTQIRRVEAQRAAEMLGVPQDRLFFHGGTDGAICDQMPHLLEGFRSMVQQVSPSRVCCGAFEQGHLDHDATNFMVNASFHGPVLEIPFYYTYLTRRPIVNRFAQPDGQEIKPLEAEDQCFKIEMAKSYPSQGIYRNLILAEARRLVTRPRSDPLKATERMRLQTHKNFLEPHLPEPLATRVRGSRRWHRWIEAVNAANP